MKQLSLILFLLISSSNIAQTDIHEIDLRNSQCHDTDTNQNTFGMIQCEEVARQEWFTEMNKYYNLLLDTLSEETAELLVSSQEACNEFNLKEHSFSSSMYYSDMDGTMWRVVNAQRVKDIVRTRALELKDYYDSYTFVR